MGNSHQNKTHIYYGQAMVENNIEPSEQKLWRAILNQALMDAFGVNTICICDHEKRDVDNFFQKRTQEFDDICDNAGLDPTRLWRKIQRLKGVQAGFLFPEKKESKTIEMFERFKERRKKYTQSHWRQNYVG